EPSRQPDDEPQHKSRARSLLTKRVTWFAAAWVAVAIAAIGSIVYITTSGGNGSDDSNTGQQGETSGEEGGIASALKDQGLLNDQDASASVDPNSVKGALTQGASGHAG